jgi:hypothetical protein
MTLFDKAFMEAFAERWNADDAMTKPLEAIQFCSRIAYGFQGEVS